MAGLSADLAVALVRRDVAGVVDAVAAGFALPCDVTCCPSCGGCLPGEPGRVCGCGLWADGEAS